MKSIEEKNKKIAEEFIKNVDDGIITDGYCDGEDAQTEFDKNQKDKPPQDL